MNSGRTHFKKGNIPWNKGLTKENNKIVKKIANSKIGKKRIDMTGKNHPNWNDGKMTTKNGYVQIMNKNHPFQSRGYVYEHRLVMEKNIGRYLKSTEHVHHINGIKNDNRIENLMLFKNNSEHIKFHKGKIPVDEIDLKKKVITGFINGLGRM